jgi:hypothetical protein
MLWHMRTTLDLPDPLFRRAKQLAEKRGIPFRALVAEALRLLVKEESGARSFKLEDVSFKGDGLVDGLSETDWERIRELAYEGRCG